MKAPTLAAIAIAAALIAGSASSADAQRSPNRPPAQAIWYQSIEGWQIGAWGVPGDYRWAVNPRGDGTITLPGRPRTGGRRTVTHNFMLTAAEHARFADLIGRFTSGGQDAGLCATDQAQDIVQWRGGTRGDGLFNFDRGCRDAANLARLALLEEAIGILRTAAQRQTAS